MNDFEKLQKENKALQAEIKKVTVERESFRLRYEIATRVISDLFKNITQERIKKTN